MAKTKQTSSAAQRRTQQRQQRQERLAGSPSKQSQEHNRGRAQAKARRNPLLLIGGVLLVLAAIIGIFFIVARQQPQSSGNQPVNSTVFAKVTQVDPNILAAIGTGNLQNPLHPVQGSPAMLKGPGGKPEFFYGGGEFCPFCAGERWAMVVALSRFGKFGHLDQITSAEGSISTFTFYHGSYSSQYIDFVPVELLGNDLNQTPLQTPTAEQNKLMTTYDTAPYTTQPGAIPFIDIANRYIQVGLAQGANGQAGFSPQDLTNMSWSDIANTLSDTSSPVAQHILGSANYLTAGICMVTNQQPGSVCNTSTIQTIERSLGKTAMNSSEVQVGAVAYQAEAIVRRID